VAGLGVGLRFSVDLLTGRGNDGRAARFLEWPARRGSCRRHRRGRLRRPFELGRRRARQEAAAQPGAERRRPPAFASQSLLAEFPDARHSVSAEQMKARALPALGDYYREDSYGAFSVTGDVVSDWLVLPKALSAYGEMKGDCPPPMTGSSRWPRTQ